MSLTELTIKNLKPKSKLYRITDSGGLVLEVTPNGSKLWRWRYRFHGKEQMAALGEYPTVSLSEARKKRDENKELVKAGKHPTREKKVRKQHDKDVQGETFEKNVREWYKNTQQHLDEKYRKSIMTRMEKYVFPSLGGMPIAEITIPDVVNVIEEIANEGKIETANRTKQKIAQVFRYAARKARCTHNPAADLKDILPQKEEKHYPCIHPKDFPKLLQKMQKLKKFLGKKAIQLMALTFVRTNELTGGMWEEIDWKKKQWRISKERMKMKRHHVVPLSRQAIEILKEIHKITGHTPFIFFSAASKKTKHVSNTILLMSLRRMGYENIMTGHGFRSLASTILNEKGYDETAIERQLAHEEEDKSRGAYNRAEYLPERKKMMQDYADMLDAMIRNDKNILAWLKHLQ
jgi:integrase